ncbi:hypothetical protein [Rhizomonospora bruguierae]|uniref:hypothetical protein n=1 Tax=Rhizomonospora bruguierae TaxID=1581705 RepID=UPI001BCC3F91|nr:hypothetical protein [Micromonospora sp. NBRC 107566]
MDNFYDDLPLWEADEDAVPPVIGRVDARTGEQLMHYETAGEVSNPDERPAGGSASPAISYDTDDGVSVSVSF